MSLSILDKNLTEDHETIACLLSRNKLFLLKKRGKNKHVGQDRKKNAAVIFLFD